MKAQRYSLITALLVAAFAIIGGAQRAGAQISPVCCTFGIIVSNTIPTTCLPITFTTNWGPSPGTSQMNVMSVRGTPSYFSVNGCMDSTIFNWVSVNGGAYRFTGPGVSPPFTFCGICAVFEVTQDLDGCIMLRLRAC